MIANYSAGETLAGLLFVLLYLTVIFIIPTWLCIKLCRNRGRRGGWAWGLFLGWIGVLVCWLRKASDKPPNAIPPQRNEYYNYTDGF
jgi:hypothetical protein